MKESAARVYKISFTIVIHKHVDVEDTIFATILGPLVNNPLVNWLGVIIIWTYQAAAEGRRWSYEPGTYLYPDLYPGSESSDKGGSDKRSK